MHHLDASPDLHPPGSHPADNEAAETPFVTVLHQRDQRPSGTFRPEATVAVRPALRTSGLLLALPPDEAKSLLLMLTFVTANGWCQPAVQQLADALRVSEAKARARMQRLQNFHWQGRPVVTLLPRASGMDGFLLSAAVLGRETAPGPEPERAPVRPPSSRAAIIARSRALYARPRAEVERMIAEQMGWKEQGDGPEARLRRRLLGVPGLTREQVDLMLAGHPHAQVEQQLDWLPHRQAKSPARFLVAAVENDYAPPTGLRVRTPQGKAQNNAQDSDPDSDLNNNPDEVPEPAAQITEEQTSKEPTSTQAESQERKVESQERKAAGEA